MKKPVYTKKKKKSNIRENVLNEVYEKSKKQISVKKQKSNYIKTYMQKYEKNEIKCIDTIIKYII